MTTNEAAAGWQPLEAAYCTYRCRAAAARSGFRGSKCSLARGRNWDCVRRAPSSSHTFFVLPLFAEHFAYVAPLLLLVRVRPRLVSSALASSEG